LVFIRDILFIYSLARRSAGAGLPIIKSIPDAAGVLSARLLTRSCLELLSMPYRRRHVFVETSKGRKKAGFTVSEHADAADVAIMLRNRGWEPYRLCLEREHHAWVATVIDWQRAA
jgi:hypothetical protein